MAGRVTEASRAAAEAILSRQSLIDQLQTVTVSAPVPAAASASVPSVATASTASTSSTADPADGQGSQGSQVSVQSVLAVVGAALLAVAAIVFTFLNPELNFGTRTAIVGVITIVFLGGAWLLARAKLRFSAEAVGALGMVFVVLDIWAFSTTVWPGVSGWVFGGIGTLVSSVVMIAVAALVRIRTWLWVALVGLAITPAFFGYAVGGSWAITLGFLAVVFATLGVHEIIRILRHRLDSPLAVDRATATTLQIAFGVVVLEQLTVSPGIPQSAAVIGALAIAAALGTRNQFAAFWSLAAGALFAAAAGILPLALDLGDTSWVIALAPLSAAAALAALGGIAILDSRRPTTSIRRTLLLIGGWGIAVLAATPAALAALAQVLSARYPLVRAEYGVTAIVGLTAACAGIVTLAVILRRLAVVDGSDAPLARGALAVAAWIALLAVLATASWTGLPEAARVAIGLAVALVLSILVSNTDRVGNLRLLYRAPIIAGAHLILVLAAVIAWSSPTLSIAGGAGVVLIMVAVAQTLPAQLRPAHTAIGFGYALIVIAHALALAQLDTVAVLCLTTAIASLFALAVTLVRRLSAGFWYAILAVTLVPFLIGIVSVLFVRSGWTALSTGVTFALALTLVITRRTGLSRYLRAFAAALLVPALAVVVVCLGAQVILVSASPITLPIIAVIVACTLPSTGLIGAALLRLGLPTVDVRLVTLWIEISALVTAALAVVLALVRAAAGLDTSFIVLLIIGLGAAVTGLTTKRRYAWAVAGASWTGALWSAWAIVGVSVLEPYILPPALAAAIVGAISVARKLPGTALYSIGLACAVLPSLVVLAVAGNGSPDVAWRAYGLLAGAIVLLIVGALLAQPSKRPAAHRLKSLQVPTLVVAMFAAAAGTIEAVRLGWSFDPTRSLPVMLPALAFSFAAFVLAANGGRLLHIAARVRAKETGATGPTRLGISRWIYAPAIAYLALGPIAAVRDDWFSIWTLWILSAALLALMLVAVARGRTRPVTLPPVWFTFTLAWCTAVAGWSERQLRVEAFSLLLGFALLAAGILAMRAQSTTKVTDKNLNSWPIGYASSWRLLTPGIVVIFLPSVLATGTDPQTLRAILVIALALVAILIGSLRKLGAPFVLGIIVLPLENITVFAVQVGHSIGAAPWWITLATAGAVLLVVAVTYERRDSGNRGVGARLRDLR
ncbi:MAG: hypothetical protein QOI14_249 [Actinomycetota bacterium]|nr:hypothetical protein [Actinomycetota bacterium]